MKVLFLTHFYLPHIGGVEKHVKEVSKELIKKGNTVKIITEKYEPKLKKHEKVDGIEVFRIKYSKTKFLGLLNIWFEILKLRRLIIEADIVHIHDVFIWFFPFRFLFPFKKVVVTIHGLEWDDPLNSISLLQKKMAVFLSNKTVGVGDFLEKYLKVKFDMITYGAMRPVKVLPKKIENSYVFVGRLEENTGLLKFLKFLDTHKNLKVDFVGDGNLKRICAKYGRVHGFSDPVPFLKKSEFCVPAGYLAALEGLSYGCKLKLYSNNEVKKDYWHLSPFESKDALKWSKHQTWSKLTNEYFNLYNN